MDNHLTPNKIQRLIYLAEDRSFNARRRQLEEEGKCAITPNDNQTACSKSTNCESSSGIIDLDRVEGFGESDFGNMSLSKSSAFNPGELTGRSTGAEDVDTQMAKSRTFDDYGRYSLAINSLASNMDKQTMEVQDIMRHSIATNYSFHSKRDLTADEASFVVKEAILPISQSTQVHIQENLSMNNSNLSMGAYFKNRCPEFGKILSKTDSPDRSMMPINEVDLEQLKLNPYEFDETLDCVPVRQPRPTNTVVKACNPPITKSLLTNAMDRSINPIQKPSIAKTQILTTSRVKACPKDVENLVPQLSQAPQMMPISNAMPQKMGVDMFVKHAAIQQNINDTEGSAADNSLSISKIADYLGKQSNVSVSDMMQLNLKKRAPRKQPLTELHLNTQDIQNEHEMKVTYLKDVKNKDTASSAGTLNTVISMGQLKIQDAIKEMPEVVVSSESMVTHSNTISARSKSPSSKSHSTLSTVQENHASFKSAESPLPNKGEANPTHVPSPNVMYKELDKSVDWRDVLQIEVKRESLVQEQWADISSLPVQGFVGVTTPVTITVTTLTDNWLTAKLQFDTLQNNLKELAIELPRLPLLLSPGKTEHLTLYITSNTEVNASLPFSLLLKDASIDKEVEHKGRVDINFSMPIIQAMSSDGLNKLKFPAVQETIVTTRYVVLLSDSPVDLQLVLTIEADSTFWIKNVQEIKKADINKALLERQGSAEDPKAKGKGLNKQLCRLSSGKALRVTIAFYAPKLAEIQSRERYITLNATLNVNLMGVATLLRKVDLSAAVGSAILMLQPPRAEEKVHVGKNPYILKVMNTGTVSGSWIVKFKGTNLNEPCPFKISTKKFDLVAGGTTAIDVVYEGEGLRKGTLVFEDVNTGHMTPLEISGGSDAPRKFPIKTNYTEVSWVRSERKEVSLKNASDQKYLVRCQIIGEGFYIDLPGVESRGSYCLPFAPFECRTLPIVFAPKNISPYKAMLHLSLDKNSDVSRKIKLFGTQCGSGARWAGLVTYGATALVRADARAPVCLTLQNRAPVSVFVAARTHFNLQYMTLESSSRLSGCRHVVPGRSKHTLTLQVDWSALERNAKRANTAALASIHVLTGADVNRRRILRILRKENGELDTSLLPDHLKILAENFEGEDSSMDELLTGFDEKKESLNELISSLQELTAQIDLPQDYAEENTILITDDTVSEHHTLCD